ncbi:MAG: class F sortase [Tetrasphaera sp.]|nr:class F sortase [Tetrasphaera sp.]
MVGTVVSLTRSPSGPTTATAVDMRGNRVTLDPGLVPVPPSKSRAIDSGQGRLIVPSVGLNVPLGALDEVDGEITPPGFTSAYLVRNLGTTIGKASSGTVYLVTHSLRGGAIGPGNYLIDVDRGTGSLAPGAIVEVSGLRYAITQSQSITKAQLPHAKTIWANTPGRLVLITCLQRSEGGPSIDNMVFTGTLLPTK